MYKKQFFLLMLVFSYSAEASEIENNNEELSFTVASRTHQYEKTKLLVACLGDIDSSFLNVAELIKKDFEFSGAWDVTVRTLPVLTLKKDIIDLFKKGFTYIVFLNQTINKDGFEWRMYERSPTWFAQPDIQMIKGAKYAKRGAITRVWAHNIADNLWPLVTGQNGFFSTRIAYCKDVHSKRKKKIKHIFVADYDGTNEQLLVSMPTVNVALRWNHDPNNPLLFYTEFTNANARMIAVSMEKKRKISSNFDGINMCPSFSPKGNRVVYCASRGTGTCQLYSYENGQLKKITNNNGNNVSPTFSKDGNKIFFCSDFETGSPQIYCYDLVHEKMTRITDGGYCACPSYNANQHKVAYSKMHKGIMQLFVYDIERNEHMQITFDKGHKEECSWSPCGNFLLFSHEYKNKSRVVMLNTVTNDRHFITPNTSVCTYPAWSPIYEQYPVVV